MPVDGVGGTPPAAGRRPPPSRRGRFAPGLDAAILDAALVELSEQGYDRMTMDDIASRAQVGKAAIYRRWSCKPAVVADAIVHWRKGRGPGEPPDTGSLRGDIDALVSAVPDYDAADLSTIKVIVGVATAATHDPVLAAALDDLVLSTPRHIIRSVLDRAVARGEVPAGRDLSLVADAAVGVNILRVVTGRPIDRVFVRRVLEDLILPLAPAAPTQTTQGPRSAPA
ncbi:TetR/AcrR family transcriptional regulator [Mycobacterium sp.]|uniref:TetR/AcrR family transcriptional regulator n=1 Tax=Mycobacterium sp. TaxID=1785 RepID=UPI002C3D44DE|nr:TetR/AcrR family transcriptional regulator [Mycobacterium sp.]HME48500.1 TetR/AcrR family transcriptional regulator [Mycobacterium sp.]